MRPLFLRSHLASFLLLVWLLHSPARAIVIQIDYTYDTGNYFTTGSAQRDRLEDAAGFFENLLTDDLDAITPSGDYSADPSPTPESWQVNFTNPSTGNNQTVDNLVVAADTIILYVGARDLDGTRLAEAGFGGAATYAYGGSAFEQAVQTRGESGVGSSDFAPWGGFVSVDDNTVWDTSLYGGGSEQHLYSTLVHEVAHVLGVGTADSWTGQISGGQFTGTESVAENGGSVPLYFNASNSRYDHWADGTSSEIWGTSIFQEVSMDPDISTGDVKLFTKLDVAGLDDIGWDIAAAVPEPSMLTLTGLSALVFVRRRCR